MNGDGVNGKSAEFSGILTNNCYLETVPLWISAGVWTYFGDSPDWHFFWISEVRGLKNWHMGDRMKPLFLISLLTLTFAISAQAQLPFRVGQPTVDGDGCPSGSVSAAVSPDGTAISILFDQFSIDVMAGTYLMPQLRRFCRFHIPLDLQAGFNLDVSKVDYRGYANLTGGNRGFIITSGNIPSMNNFTIGNNQLTTQLSPGSANFLVSQPLNLRVRNHCQPMPNLEFTTVIHVLGPNARGGGKILNEEAMLMIDSLDVGGREEDAIRLNLSVTPCQP
jgi:hypothetical protein